MMDLIFIVGEINRLTEKINERLRWLKYAKQPDVIEFIYEEIAELEYKKQMYLNLL